LTWPIKIKHCANLYGNDNVVVCIVSKAALEDEEVALRGMTPSSKYQKEN
jgi:hypothetical protein